jgi:hypothetical protein
LVKKFEQKNADIKQKEDKYSPTTKKLSK